MNSRHIPLKEGSTCFECGEEAHVNHHVIPYSLGGRNVVALCNMHHDIIHGLKREWHSDLIKRALKKARSEGKTIGAPKKYNREKELSIIEDWFKTGASHRALASKHGLSPATVCRIIKAAITAKEREVLGE